MGKIIKEIQINNKEELIKALQSFPKEMFLLLNTEPTMTLSHVIPDKDEISENENGYLILEEA